MKSNGSLLREKPEYEEYSDNVVILTEEEEKELGIYNPPRKKCCGSAGNGCGGCGSSKSGSKCCSKKIGVEQGGSSCQGGCCKK